MKFKDIQFQKTCDLILEKTIRFILRFNKSIILAVLLITGVCAFWLPKINIGSAIDVLYPAHGDPERDFLERTYKVFGTDLVQTIAITSEDTFSYSTLKKIQNLTSEIEKFPTVEHVLSLTNAAIIEHKYGGLLIRNLASKDVDVHIEGAGYLKAGGEEIFVRKLSENVPETKEGLEQFKKDILNNPLYTNNLVSQDLKTTVVNVYFKKNYSDNVLRKTENQIEKLALSSAGPEEIYSISPLAISPLIFKMLSRDLSIYLPWTLIIIVTILLISFRDWKVVLVSLVSLGMAVICVYSLMAILQVPIFILTAAIAPVIAIQGLAYCIHLFYELSAQSSLTNDRKQAVAQTLRNVLPAIFLSTLAAAIGFVSVAPVNVVAIRQMGIFLSIGIVIVFLIVCLFLPSTLLYFYPKRRPDILSFDASKYYKTGKIALFCIKHRIFIFLLTGLLSVVSFYGLSKLVVETDINQAFRPSSPFRRAVDMVATRLKGATPINIIIEGRDDGDLENPAVLESIGKLQAILDRQPVIGKSISVVDYLKFISRAFHNNDPQYFVIPNSRGKIARYLHVYSLADPSKTLNRYIDKDRKTVNISLRSSLTNTAGVLKFKRFIEDECSRLLPPNVSWKVTSYSVLMATVAQKLSRGILFGFTQATLMIFLIMVLLSRSIKLGIVSMIPNVAPLLFVLGVMGFAGISFNVGTSIVVCIAIGIAVDDTIHFLVRYFQELKQADDQKRAIVNTFKHEHGPITLIGVSVILGFIVLTFSQFVPMALFGVLTALALFFGIICELLILPALLASIKIKNKLT